MLPARHRAFLIAKSHRSTASRSQHTQTHAPALPSSSELTGSAKLLADALAEESLAASESGPSDRNRNHLLQTQGPIWTGDEAQSDAVLRMLVDKHKPLRTGDGVKWNSSDEKIKGWMKGLKLEPRLGVSPQPPSQADNEGEIDVGSPPSQAHRTVIPPHLHRPWHSTYTGHVETAQQPKIKYGTFIKSRATGDDLVNILELSLPANADAKTKARIREARKAGKMVRRVEKAREGALDYKLGIEDGEVVYEIVGEDGEGEGQFRGNRQVKGSSVLGAGKGGASGLRAWAGLVEDRIQVSSVVALRS